MSNDKSEDQTVLNLIKSVYSNWLNLVTLASHEWSSLPFPSETEVDSMAGASLCSEWGRRQRARAAHKVVGDGKAAIFRNRLKVNCDEYRKDILQGGQNTHKESGANIHSVHIQGFRADLLNTMPVMRMVS